MTIDCSAKGFTLTTDLEKYAHNKAARLKRRLPRKFREGACCRIRFTQVVRKGTKHNTCNITFTFDDSEFKVAETTLHMYAALDVAAVNVEQQLRDYVKMHRRGLLGRRPRID
jgi:ribosome-associated translation inhibitor RaiA